MQGHGITITYANGYATSAMNGVNSMNGAGASRSTAPSTSPSPPTRYLVLDTNVLLSHFPTVKALHARMLGGDAWLLIPTTVVTGTFGEQMVMRPAVERRWR
jgi:hypothetical protein